MTLFSFLDLYIFGWLVSCNVSCVWEMSNIKIHLFNMLHRVFRRSRPKIYTEEEWQVEMELGGYGKLGELLMCIFCYGTWLSASISAIGCYFLGYSYYMVLVCALSWPTLNFAVIKKLKET